MGLEGSAAEWGRVEERRVAAYRQARALVFDRETVGRAAELSAEQQEALAELSAAEAAVEELRQRWRGKLRRSFESEPRHEE